MCGRFVGYRRIDELRKAFSIDRVADGVEDAPSYNVAPTQKVLAVVRKAGENVLGRLTWGLVPHWAKDPGIGAKLINARAETVAVKPAFRAAYRKRRCLVPADGFYEWTGGKGSRKPVFVTLPEEAPFGFAGLWEFWDPADPGEAPLFTCTIVTTDASPSIRHIHHRMPVILKPETQLAWLEPGTDAADLQRILSEGIQDRFRHHPVSTAVNSGRNNSRDLIAAVD